MPEIESYTGQNFGKRVLDVGGVEGGCLQEEEAVLLGEGRGRLLRHGPEVLQVGLPTHQ